MSKLDVRKSLPGRSRTAVSTLLRDEGVPQGLGPEGVAGQDRDALGEVEQRYRKLAVQRTSEALPMPCDIKLSGPRRLHTKACRNTARYGHSPAEVSWPGIGSGRRALIKDLG